MFGAPASANHSAAAGGAPVKAKKFVKPEGGLERFGVLVDTDTHTEGVCDPEEVSTLLSAFGVPERSGISFPFQHLHKQHGELWSLRVEEPRAHHVDGQTVYGHQWIYRREQPEESSGG